MMIGSSLFIAIAESMEDEPQGLVLVPRGSEDSSDVVGSHIRGSRLRASSSTGDEEVDLLLPGTARYFYHATFRALPNIRKK